MRDGKLLVDHIDRPPENEIERNRSLAAGGRTGTEVYVMIYPQGVVPFYMAVSVVGTVVPPGEAAELSKLG